MKKFKKILVVGGLHGDEPTGIEVAKYFQKHEENIDGLICHSKAIKAKKRFLETDLNRSFSVNTPISLEEKLAVDLKDKISGYDLIIDIHNTKAEKTLCAIVVTGPSAFHLSLAHYFGFKRILVMPSSGSFISLLPKTAISLEVPTDEMKNFSSDYLVSKIKSLVRRGLDVRERKNIEIFTFVNKVEKSTFNRLNHKRKDFKNFRKLTLSQSNSFGLDRKYSYYPIFLKQKEAEETTFILVKKFVVK